jgi:hypothetical protein
VVAIFVGMIALFIVLMTLVYSLPQDGIIANAADSVVVMLDEGMYPTRILDDNSYRLDNYTDALMMDIAVRDTEQSAFVSSVANIHDNALRAGNAVDPLLSLAATAVGQRQSPAPYAYYWHGYQVALRPALMVLDYTQIRYLNMLLLTLLVAFVVAGLKRDAGGVAAGVFVLALAITGYLIVPMSLQYSNMTYLTLVATLALMLMLRAGTFQRFTMEFFLVVGMLTSFFDLLTTPLLTLCMPLAVLLIITSKSKTKPLSAYIYLTARLSAVWVIGYVGAWVAKWVLATVVLPGDWITLAVKQVLFRTGMDGGTAGPVAAIVQNLTRLVPTAAVGTLMIVAGIVVLILVVRFRRPTDEVKRAAIPMILAPLPYAWFVVANNHSSIHSWFTYRIQLVTVFTVAYFLLSMLDMDRVRAAYSRAVLRSPEPVPGEGRLAAGPEDDPGAPEHELM